MLILYFDTMWNQPLESHAPLPAGFEITTDRTRYRDAHAVVFHIPEWKWWPRLSLPRKLANQVWVAWSMESEENYRRLKDPRFMRLFDMTMTHRLDSDVPVPYFTVAGTPQGAQALYAALASPPRAKTARAPVVAFISSRVNRSGRRDYVRDLMRHLPIDSYGTFMNNARLENDRGRPSKLETIARYRFTLAFENAISPDYVTEKLLDPLLVGSVPVYLGAPNVATFAPGERSYIPVTDFANPAALAGYLRFLLQHDAAYEEYLAWKQEALRPSFRALVEQYGRPAHLRLCERLRALARGRPSHTGAPMPTSLRDTVR